MSTKPRLIRWTFFSILLAISIGLLGRYFHWGWLKEFAIYLEFGGKVWILSVLLLAIPLSGAYIISSILALAHSKYAGSIGKKSIYWLFVLTIASVGFTLFYTLTLISIFSDYIPRLNIDSDLSAYTIGKDTATAEGIRAALSVVEMIQSSIGNIFLVLVVTCIASGFLVFRIRGKIFHTISKISTKLAKKSLWFMVKYLISMPVGVFCVILPLVLKTGYNSISFLIFFIPVFCLILFLGTLFFYPVVHWFGSVPLKNFAKDMIPSQLFALSSSSSLATLPYLLECAEQRLKLPSSVSGLVLPFFISSFKMNYAFSGAFQLILLAFVFGIELSFSSIALFIISHLFLGMANPGIPGGAHYSSLPLFVAAGLPGEAYILAKTLYIIPDMFMTLVNVTGPMAVAVVVSKNFSQEESQLILETGS